MKTRQLTQLLSTLSRQEHIALRRFVAGPYWCGSEPARKVLIQLSKIISTGRYISASPASLFRAAGIKTAKPDLYFNKLQSIMVNAVTDFLTVERIRGDRIWWAQEKALTLASHEASLVESRGRKAEKNVHNAASMDITDQEYLIQRFRMTAEALNATTVNNTFISQSGLDDLLTFAVQSGATRNRKVKLYADLVRLVRTADKALWQELFASTDYIKRAMPKDDAHDFLMLMLNVTIRFVNQGSPTEYLGLIGKMEDLDLLTPSGHIQYPVYINTVVTALQAQQFEWAAAFMRRHRRALPAAGRSKMHGEAMAVYFFYKHWRLGDPLALEQSHDYLLKAQDVINGDVLETYRGRTYLTMILIERGEDATALSLIRSTIRLLNRHRHELSYKHPLWLRFFQVAEKLLTLPHNAPAMASDMAMRKLEELQASPSFAGKDWLTEKLQSHVDGSSVIGVVA